MRRVWLDYAQIPAGYRWPGIALCAAGVIATGALTWIYQGLTNDIDHRELHLMKLQRQASVLPTDSVLAGTLSLPETLRQALKSGSATTWDRRFGDLEAAIDDTVTLLTLSPDKSSLTLSGEAKTLSSAIGYAKRLQGASSLSYVHLVDHTIAKEHPQRPVRFTVLARWREEAQ